MLFGKSDISGWKNLFVIALPSIGAYLTGFVFGVNTTFLLYFIPAIWLGNFIYVYLIKKFSVAKHQLVQGIVYFSIVKSALLFVVALGLVSLKIVPQPFLFAMGPLQLVTALSGGFLGSLVTIFRKN